LTEKPPADIYPPLIFNQFWQKIEKTLEHGRFAPWARRAVDESP
jgi:hypothetical protein